jgi:hypothetical protein
LMEKREPSWRFVVDAHQSDPLDLIPSAAVA